VVHREVVQPQHRQVQLRDEQVGVVARIADQRDPLRVANGHPASVRCALA
jgi:hypothetical protein